MKEDIRETRLENGLTILTDRMPGVRSVTLGFFLRTGARHEPAELNGISHFIEHAVFKGTERRSALDIAIEQDRLGGNLDAFTTHEEIGFAIKVIDEHISQAFDLIADMLTNPRFDEKELKSEQRVIIEEMKMMDDSPEESLSEIFNRVIFPDHPLGLPITGTPRTVRKFGHDLTRGYHSKIIDPANLVITAAGNIQHGELVVLAKNYFGERPKTGNAAVASSRPEISAPIVIKQNANLEQAHLIVATPFVGAKEDKRYAADLLAAVLGGGTSSRLWQKIREERGLAYSVGASAVMFKDCGFFSIYAGTSPEQTEQVLDLSIAELSEVVKGGVEESELDLAKKQAATSVLLGLEDSATRAAALAQSEILYGRQITVDETLARIDAVTVDQICEIAREHFQTEKVAFAALGSLNGLKVDRERLAIKT